MTAQLKLARAESAQWNLKQALDHLTRIETQSPDHFNGEIDAVIDTLSAKLSGMDSTIEKLRAKAEGRELKEFRVIVEIELPDGVKTKEFIYDAQSEYGAIKQYFNEDHDPSQKVHTRAEEVTN